MNVPQYFDRRKFELKFNLQFQPYYFENGQLFTPTLPGLTDADLLDCVFTDPADIRQADAKPFAKSIPNWASWSQAEWQTYFDNQLSDAQVDLVTSLAAARVMLKRQNLVIENLVKLIIALRDEIYPDLPDP